MAIKSTNLPRTLVAVTEPQKPLTAGEAHSSWHHRWQVIYQVQQRESRSMFHSQGVYLVLSLSLLVTLVILQNYLNFVQEQGLLVTSRTFSFPLFTGILLASLFLALSAIATIRQDEDDDLFDGTVDPFSYILGKQLAYLTTYLIMVGIYGGCLILLAGQANFTFSLDLSWTLFLSVMITLNGVALGTFLAVIGGQARTARNLFFGIGLAFLVIQFGPLVLANIPSQGLYDNLILSWQNGLTSLNGVITWISPYAYLSQGMEAVKIGSQTAYLTVLLKSVLQTTIFLSLSIIILDRRERQT